MVTKEQALSGKNFIQTHCYESKMVYNGSGYLRITGDKILPLDKPIKWRKNGKCKTFKRESNKHRFSLPIKHGLYNFAYITDENCHLFELVD